jgi:hypothetical protein
MAESERRCPAGERLRSHSHGANSALAYLNVSCLLRCGI